jgi:hypothetical protein
MKRYVTEINSRHNARYVSFRSIYLIDSLNPLSSIPFNSEGVEYYFTVDSEDPAYDVIEGAPYDALAKNLCSKGDAIYQSLKLNTGDSRYRGNEFVTTVILLPRNGDVSDIIKHVEADCDYL